MCEIEWRWLRSSWGRCVYVCAVTLMCCDALVRLSNGGLERGGPEKGEVMDLCFCVSLCCHFILFLFTSYRYEQASIFPRVSTLPLCDCACFINWRMFSIPWTSSHLRRLIPEHSNCEGEGTEGHYVGIRWPPISGLNCPSLRRS